MKLTLINNEIHVQVESYTISKVGIANMIENHIGGTFLKVDDKLINEVMNFLNGKELGEEEDLLDEIREFISKKEEEEE